MNAQQKLIQLKDAAKGARLDWEYDSGVLRIAIHDGDSTLNLDISHHNNRNLHAQVIALQHVSARKTNRYTSDYFSGENLRKAIRGYGRIVGISMRKLNKLVRFLDSVTE